MFGLSSWVFYLFFSQVAIGLYAVMHEAVVLDSGVHCVRCQLRDFRVLNSTQKKNTRIYSRTENLCHSARLVPYHHTEKLKGRGTEGRHPTISELDQVCSSCSQRYRKLRGYHRMVAAASVGTVLANNRKSVSCSLFVWELLVYAVVDVDLFLYETIRNQWHRS